MAAQIPARNTSKYAGQYAGRVLYGRLVEIFTDSCRIALSSKIPETAGDRFAVAVEIYHQLMSEQQRSFNPLPADIRGWVQQAMEHLAESFPVQVVANEALGLREKARKLKTPRKRLDLLRQAGEVLDRGLAEHPWSPVLLTAAAELLTEISQSEAPARPMQGDAGR